MLYFPCPTAGNTGTTTLTANQQLFVGPFTVTDDVTFNRLGLEITAAAALGSKAVLSIYLESNDLPTVLVAGIEIPIDTVGVVEGILSAPLKAGLRYFMSINAQVSFSCLAFSNANAVRSRALALSSANHVLLKSTTYNSITPSTESIAYSDRLTSVSPAMYKKTV
jgi:hypothetical protein